MGVVGTATEIKLRLIVDELDTQIPTVSGYILDGDGAGVYPCAIFITGDTYALSETDEDGYYETNLINGSYTITPYLAGSTFYPSHDDIIVSGDAVTVDTMVEVWLISGDIVDEADAGIDAVTVALTGDKTDSALTGIAGHYEFANVPNGSYTVTPTKTDYVFTPDHRDVTVTDSNETVGDMVSSSETYFDLPVDYNWNDGSSLDTGIWTDSSNDITTFVGNIDTQTIATFTPTYTKCLDIRCTQEGSGQYGALYLDDARDRAVIFDKSEGLRMQVQASRYTPVSNTTLYILLISEDDTVRLSATYTNNGTDVVSAREQAPAYDVQGTANPSDTASNVAQWVNLRLEIDAGFSNIYGRVQLDGTGGFTSATKAIVTDISSVDFDRIRLMLYHYGTGYGQLVRVWLGKVSDSWPTE